MDKQPMWRRFNTAQRLSVATAILLAVWLLSGIVFPSKSSRNAQDTAHQVVVPTVRVQNSTAQNYQRKVTVFGETKSSKVVDIFAELDGKIQNMTDKKGEIVQAGEWLATLKPEDRPARLAKAEALVKQKKLEYNVASSLLRKGHQSETRVAENLANLRSAEADLAAMKLEMERTKIVAPFAGFLQQTHVKEDSSVRRLETPIVTLMDHTKPAVIAHVPEKYRHEIRLGALATVKLTTGEEIPAVVDYTSYIADSETRTFEVEVALMTEATVYAGLTAEVSIFAQEERVHFISSSSLALSDEGVLGVKALEEGRVVKFYPIEIVQSTQDGLYVAGLPDKSTIITLGQAFLREGDIAMLSSDKEVDHDESVD